MADIAKKQVKVAKTINAYKVVLNAGKLDGVAMHQSFLVYRQGEEIVDPDTNEQLGVFEEVIGRGIITNVQDRISTLESSEVLENGRKIIRKGSPFSLGVSPGGFFAATTEEIVEDPERIKPFQGAMVGDFAKEI
jgi:hypothetical protein